MHAVVLTPFYCWQNQGSKNVVMFFKGTADKEQSRIQTQEIWLFVCLLHYKLFYLSLVNVYYVDYICIKKARCGILVGIQITHTRCYLHSPASSKGQSVVRTKEITFHFGCFQKSIWLRRTILGVSSTLHPHPFHIN